MGSLSNYLENALLDHLFQEGTADYVSPTIYVALSKADPGEDGSGIDEPSGGSYARVTTGAASWNLASGDTVDNAAAVTFPEATLDWGVITHFALFDALAAGNMLAYGALAASKTVVSGQTPEFAIGALTISMD